ncbi:GntR family transcriptional regulator [Aureimonas sp. AU20]|uniref:GntR family transcriptional regulator n=1 Tax=Aureimonas sp. AU20 TaxID=1349819 RepID=UPI00071F524A|nr:GntR family transcriptional regulator [Aureimonas sp. AU20]ALN75142.1 hypothetical protein M673_20635 [Aureimonas sp. AU20]
MEPSSAAPGRAAISERGLNLVGLAYRSVSDMIRDRRLRGGDVIVEAKLAETLGISRTPMREALQRLEGEGLVHKGDGRNYVVRRVELGEYLQSLKLRLLIEPEAAAQAIGSIPNRQIFAVRHEINELLTATTYHTDRHWLSDDNLHGMIIEHCGNEVMARVLRELRATTRLFEIDQLKDRLIPDSTEHLRIIEALQASAVAEAREAVAAHVRSLIDFALQSLLPK